MGLWDRIKSFGAGLFGSEGWVVYGGGYGHVDGEPITDKSALCIGTYYSCIRNIAEDTAKLPYRTQKNEKRKRIRIDDGLDYIFNVAFNPKMTAFQGRSTMMQWACGWGRAYAEIVRDGRGIPRELYPIHPSRVCRKEDKNGYVTYEIHNNNGTVTSMSPQNIFHLYGLGDGYEGYSVCKLMAGTLGTAVAAQNIAKTFFERGAMPGGVLETKNAMKPDSRKALREDWERMYGGPQNAGKTAVLEFGVTYKAMTLPFKDVQLLELRQFQKEEIAQWFRMPLHKLQFIKNAQGWSTLDAQETDYVNSCLMPWLVRFEQEVKRQLIGSEGDAKEYYAHLEVKGLLRGAIKERTEYYTKLFTMGAITPNEIRGFEDMDASDDEAADELYTQGANVPLSKAGAQQMQTGSPTAQDPEDPAPDNEPADPKDAPAEGNNRVAALTNGNGVHHG